MPILGALGKMGRLSEVDKHRDVQPNAAPLTVAELGDWPNLTAEDARRRRKLGLLAWAAFLAMTGIGIFIEGSFALTATTVFFTMIGYAVALRIDAQCFAQVTKSDLRLIEQSDTTDQGMVDIRIEFRGGVRGIDRGVLWSDGDAVHFKGRRIWFRIRRSDLLSQGSFRRRRIWFELWGQPPSSMFCIKHPAGPLRIQVQPARQWAPTQWQADETRRLVSQAQLGLTESGETEWCTVPSAYPPLDFDYYYRPKLRYLGIVVGLFTTVGSAISLFNPAGYPAGGCFGILGGGILLAVSTPGTVERLYSQFLRLRSQR